MASAGSASRIAFDEFVLDRADERLLGESGPIRIGHKAYCVLDTLVAANGRLVTKDELFDCVWDGAAVSESALTSVVKELRRALGDDTREPRFIESVYGRGYRFLAPVSVSSNAGPIAKTQDSPPAANGEPRFTRRSAAIGLGGAAILGFGAIAALRPRTVTAWFGADAREHRIAVLPFANLSGDPAQDYFADGVAEELRTRLSRLPTLQVAARTSSNSFRGSEADIGTIGRKLDVAYVIEGSVRRAADVVRIAARLIDVPSGFEHWSQSYDRPFADIFAVQSDIAEAVTRAMQGEVLGEQSASLDQSGTTVPAAFDSYARGRALFDLSGDEATYRSALAAFDRAIALDPRYAAAHAARARTLAAIANQFTPPDRLRATYREGLAAARRAVALAPDLDEAQSALGYLLAYGMLDFAAARQPYARSLQLGPGNPDVLIRYGLFGARVGDAGPATAALRKAALLDPLNPRAFKALGQALYSLRDYPGAIAALRKALELSPNMNSAHAAIGDALLMQGRLEEAKAEYLAEPQALTRLTGSAIVEARLGRRDAARAALAELKAKLGDSAAYQQAQILAQWGDREGALKALDRAWQVGDSGLLYLRNDPMLDGLRKEPEFGALMSRLGFASRDVRKGGERT